MEKDQIILLDNRGLILISGEDAKIFFKTLLLTILKSKFICLNIFSSFYSSRQIFI